MPPVLQNDHTNFIILMTLFGLISYQQLAKGLNTFLFASAVNGLSQGFAFMLSFQE